MESIVFTYWQSHNCHHVIIHFLTPRIYFRTHCLFKHGSFIDPYAILFFYLLNFTVYPLFSWLLQIAITGKSFCRASAIATELIISNILRIGRVNVIGDVILYLGKLCVSLSSALFAFLMLDTHKYRSAHNKISSPLLPVLVCALFQARHLDIQIVAQYLSSVLFLCYRNQWFKMSLSCAYLYVCRSAGLSVTLLRPSSSLWWRCQLMLSFFHSVRIRRSTRGQHNMLLLFWWRHWVIKMRCRDLLNETY